MSYSKIKTTGKIVLQGKLTLLSALKIASGADNVTDSDVILDSQNKPYIPGTSLSGKLKTLVQSEIKDNLPGQKERFRNYWGLSMENESCIDFSNCLLISDQKEAVPEIRDGIEINPKTKQTVPGSKYDFQVVPKGKDFSFEIILDISDEKENCISHTIAAYLSHYLIDGVNVGGKTGKGLGKIKAVENNFRQFNFNEPGHAEHWFIRDFEKGGCIFEPVKVEVTPPDLHIIATFSMKTPLIIGADDKKSASDKSNIKSGDDYIIPGTSLHGVLKDQAGRIARHFFEEEKAIKMLNYLWGAGDKKKNGTNDLRQNREQKTIPSRVEVNETDISDPKPFIQPRIQIDRFTSGNLGTALFDSETLFAGELKELEIKVKKASDQEIGILLLVFADLWLGEIALGGETSIGRGLLEGKNVSILIKEKEPVQFSKDSIPETFDALDSYVENLVEKK